MRTSSSTRRRSAPLSAHSVGVPQHRDLSDRQALPPPLALLHPASPWMAHEPAVTRATATFSAHWSSLAFSLPGRSQLVPLITVSVAVGTYLEARGASRPVFRSQTGVIGQIVHIWAALRSGPRNRTKWPDRRACLHSTCKHYRGRAKHMRANEQVRAHDLSGPTTPRLAPAIRALGPSQSHTASPLPHVAVVAAEAMHNRVAEPVRFQTRHAGLRCDGSQSCSALDLRAHRTVA